MTCDQIVFFYLCLWDKGAMHDTPPRTDHKGLQDACLEDDSGRNALVGLMCTFG